MASEVSRTAPSGRPVDDGARRGDTVVPLKSRSRPVASSGPEPRYTIASLFSGIGGFELGFEAAGFGVTFQCELNTFCRSVLEHHWPDVPRHSNIKELDIADIPDSDVWVAGFPCQDVSLARMGTRAGLRGAQSGLFYQFARLVGERRPRIFVLENVSGLLSSHKGRDFGLVLGTLAELGFDLGWRVLDSQHFGVPQSRKRVYIIGCDRDRHGPASILLEPECGQGVPSTRGADGAKPVPPLQRRLDHPGPAGAVTKAIAYCLYAESARHTGTDWSRNYVSYPRDGEVRRLTPRECEGVMAFPDGWTDIKVGLDEEAQDTARYHALGNAVTPPVAEWVARRVRRRLEELDGLSGVAAPMNEEPAAVSAV